MRRRVVLSAIVLLVLGLAFSLGWTLLGWPPPGFLLKYGLTPHCKPTGRVASVEGIEFVEIGPGCFRMGSKYLSEGGDWLGKLCAKLGLPWGDPPKASDEMPIHWVDFERGFWISRFEVTNEQYERFDPDHDRTEMSPGDRCPVESVSWEDAKAFCLWLHGRSGLRTRLPSEAEWEAACRAGSKAEFCFGSDENGLGDFAWFAENSEERARVVGTRRGNQWGLFDLHGNIWEYCLDRWHGSYEGAPANGSAWTAGSTEDRVVRGGCWDYPGEFCRSSLRIEYVPCGGNWNFGFRPAFTLSPDEEQVLVPRLVVPQ